MQYKNPLFFMIIPIVIICLMLALIVYKNLIQSAGAISLTTGEISQSADSASPDFHVVSVVAEDLTVPFFGTAFHINYNPQNYTYDHFSLGDYFTSQDDPMVLVNAGIAERIGGSSTSPDISPATSPAAVPGKIIVGISLKRGQLITKPKGTLLKLYFKKTSIMAPDDNFSFSNAVFSSFDKQHGERKDIQNITFTPRTIEQYEP